MLTSKTFILSPYSSLSSCLRLSHMRLYSSRASPNFYSILGVKSNADQKEIKEKFYQLSKEHHPDISKEESSLKKFREIAEAYEVLSNVEKRREYDSQMGVGGGRPSPEGGGQYQAGSYSYQHSDGSTRVRYHGMKGEFRNGTFVDDEPEREHRNIQYDLDPEKMEKIWVSIIIKGFRLSELSLFSAKIQEQMGETGRG